MIQDIFYYDVYLVIITLLTFFYLTSFFQSYSENKYYFKKDEKISGAFSLTILMILFIGFRPISPVFVDMPGYAFAMTDGRFEGEEISWNNNFIFVPMMAFLSSHGASEQTPIVILAIINFGAALIACRKFFPKDTYLAMLVYCGAFSTFSGATNGLKAGCAGSLFLAALAYKENKKTFITFLLLSLGFHHSMQLPIGATLICLYYKKTDTYMKFWIICFLFSLFHITFFQDLFGERLSDVDQHGANYLTTYATAAESEYKGKTGFRYDFVIYSVIPILIYYHFKKKKKNLSDTYTNLINIYILANAIWLLCMYASYTNRIAALSWALYPILVIFPYIKNKIRNSQQEINLCMVALIHLSFTLFMHFIYYDI